MNLNNCYITLMTQEKFLPIIIRCHQSLQYYHSKYPLIVMVPENDKYLQNQLKKYNILYKPIHIDKFQEDNILSPYNDTINKFQIFNFTEYDYLCFIDADIIFFNGNIDNEFDLAIQKNSKFYGYFETDRIEGKEIQQYRLMGGLFIVKPDPFFYPSLKNLIREKSLNFNNDEEVLKQFFLKDTDVHTVPDAYTHFGGFIKIWELKAWPSFAQHFFYDNLSIDELGFWLDHPALCLGEFRAISNNYNQNNFNINRAFIIIPTTVEELQKSIEYSKAFERYGYIYSLIICIDSTLITYKNDLLATLDTNRCCFKIFNNLKNKSYYQQLKFIEQEFGNNYIMLCLIANFSFKIEENLDLLLSVFTASDIKKEILNKYNNSLIYLNLQE